jgi:hypothetical protein
MMTCILYLCKKQERPLTRAFFAISEKDYFFFLAAAFFFVAMAIMQKF